MIGTTMWDFAWPGRLPSIESLSLYGVIKRIAGVHGLLSRLSTDCKSQTVGQGCRIGASSIGCLYLPIRTSWFIFFLLFITQIAFSAEPKGSGQALKESPQSKTCGYQKGAAPAMVVIEPGSFMMGSPLSEIGRDKTEGPMHEVLVQKFALSRCEITVGEFGEFVEAKSYVTDAEKRDEGGNMQGCFSFSSDATNWRNPGFEQSENDPVVCVSYRDAMAYVKWLSDRTKKNYDLPSEAQWEYAARAGSQTRYSWGDDIGRNNANCADCGSQWDGKRTAPVQSFTANAFGLFDMHGNVWEWVKDCWHADYTSAPNDGSAWLEEQSGDCSSRVVRGGSWLNTARYMRSAIRGGYSIDVRNFNVGFRVARTLDQNGDANRK